MKQEYNLQCGCGAKATFAVDFNTFNQSRVDSLLWNLRQDAVNWEHKHKDCRKKNEKCNKS